MHARTSAPRPQLVRHHHGRRRKFKLPPSHHRIRNLIEERTRAGWQFIYLSADLAAFADSDRIAIAESSRMAFDKNSRGTRYAFADLSRNIAESRSGLKSRAQAFFEESDRAKQDLETRRRGG